MNWTRFQVQSIDAAMALARLVLPTPGTSSIKRWPSASREISASSIGSRLPCSTRATFEQMASKNDENRVPAPVPGGAAVVDVVALTTGRLGAEVIEHGSMLRRSNVGTVCAVAAAVGIETAPFLAIDVASHRLAAGVVSADGDVIVRDRVAAPSRDQWPALHRLVRRVLAAAEDLHPLGGCGVVCEGPLDLAAGTVMPLHLPSLVKFELRQRIADLTYLPTALGTTGQARALAEHWIGSTTDCDNFAFLYVSETVEAGFVVDGRLLSGRLGNTGHVAHVVVEPDGAACRCGNAGCLRAYVAVSAIEEETNRPMRRAPPATIERTGAMLGRVIASCCAMLDVQRIVLAGAVPSIFGAPLLDAMRRELDQRSRLGFLRSGPDQSAIEIDVTSLGGEATLVGAAAIGRHWLVPSGADGSNVSVPTP